MNKENRLLIAKNHAEALNGICLSDIYLGVDYKMLWKCNNLKHKSWDASYYSVVVNNSWCLQCAYQIKGDKKRNSNGLNEAQEYAKKRNGICLSTEYKNAKTKLEWKCVNPRHSSWEASYDNTVNGKKWCNECSSFYYKEHQVRKILEYLLNTVFKKRRDLAWNINNKTGKKLELDGYSEDLKLAFEFQGKQHYEIGHFINSEAGLLELIERDKIKKENCVKNNIKLLIFNDCKSLNSPKALLSYVINILTNQNIKHINYNYKYIEKIYYESNNFQLEQFKNANEHAKSLNGQCLSKSYHNSKEKLIWKCENPKHFSWEATYSNVVKNKTWCPECSGKLKPEDFLEKARIYANSKGGYCLSDNFVNVKSLMSWKCNNPEHDTWQCSYYNITSRKTWCPYCANKFSKEYKLEKSIEYAKSVNGICLSKEYKNNSTKMLWKCDNASHLPWEASYNSVINKKTWCLNCYRYKKKID